MRLTPIFILLLASSCSGKKPQAEDRGGNSASQKQRQSVREGIEVLCSSTWNGELHGNSVRHRLPDTLMAEIPNDSIQRILVALTSPDVSRTAMFNGFLEENQLAEIDCRFRDRLASWPRQLPIKPAP